jgi:iron-sulfur cluster assembly protein
MALLEIQTDDLTLTKAAADAVQDLLAKRDLEGYGLRVYIAGGGCSGYQYGMALENNFRENDKIFSAHGVQVVVDEMSLGYLQGATVDFVDELMGSGFKIENPNAVASCGCGSSFKTRDDAAPETASGNCC